LTKQGEIINGRLVPIISKTTETKFIDEEGNIIREVIKEEEDMVSGEKKVNKERFINKLFISENLNCSKI